MEDNRFLRGLFDGMRCGVICVDLDGRIVFVNDPAVQILGLPRQPDPGAAVSESLGAHPEIAQLLLDSFGMTHLPNREELAIGDDPETGMTLGYTLSPIASDDGEPSGIAMFFRDLTQIERKEEQERLRDRLVALGQMAAGLAHEIRNPLASIEVTCSLLRRRLGPDSSERALLDKVAAEVKRLNRTISSSLEFVRPVTVTPVETEILPLLEEAIEVARERSGTARTVIAAEVAPALPRILLDRVQIRQVFENLILNALEAIGDEGQVLVEAELVPGVDSGPGGKADLLLEVRVSDSGQGIPNDEQDKIFYPFFTTKKEGSGVGLPMAKKIVDGHKGLIDVDAAPLGGARFTVRLPTGISGRTDNP